MFSMRFSCLSHFQIAFALSSQKFSTPRWHPSKRVARPSLLILGGDCEALRVTKLDDGIGLRLTTASAEHMACLRNPLMVSCGGDLGRTRGLLRPDEQAWLWPDTSGPNAVFWPRARGRFGPSTANSATRCH